jgi:hypothetical protein
VEKLAIIASTVRQGKAWARDYVVGRCRAPEGKPWPASAPDAYLAHPFALHRNMFLRKRFNLTLLPTNLKAAFMIIHKICG